MTNPFMARAIALSIENVRSGQGGPFGAVVVKDGSIIAEGVNQVTQPMTLPHMPKCSPFVWPARNWESLN